MNKKIAITTISSLCAICSIAAQNPYAKNNILKTKAQVVKKLSAATATGKVLFAHQDFPFYGHDWQYEPERSDVKDVCGDYPAVLGCELGELELGHDKNLDGVPFKTMRAEIIKHHARGGITTISWHCTNPENGGSSWDCKENTTVASVVEDAQNHDKFIGWIDTVADFLLSLRGADGEQIPVIFRPWHEHTGSWFWWGQRQCTTDDYMELWTMTLDRFKAKGLDNILMAYSPSNEGSQTEQQYMERCPIESVDILGLDAYHNGKGGAGSFIEMVQSRLKLMEKIATDHNKVIALTEVGAGGVPMSDWWSSVLQKSIEGRKVSYVLLWRNANREIKGEDHYFVPFKGQISEQDFIEFSKQSQNVFLKDMNTIE